MAGIPPSAIRNCSDNCPTCVEGGPCPVVKTAIAVQLESCGDAEPIPVEITNPTPDVEKVVYCNEDTNTQWQKICTYKFDPDGNTIEEIISETDLGIPCSEPVPDIEKNERCNPDTNTIWIQECFYQTQDGVTTKTILDDYDTGRPCDAEGEIFCKKWQTLAVGIDNNAVKGVVRYQWDSTIELTMSDGSTITFNQTPTSGWTQQITQWANTLQAIFPDADIQPRCNIVGGCGGLLGPVSDAPLGMYARYVHMSFCPTDIYPVSAKIISGDGVGVVPIMDWNLTPEKRGYQCVNCDGTVGPLKFEDGTDVPEADLPACTFECAETIPQPPVSPVEILTGCDDGTDPVTDVIAIVNTDTNEIGYFTADVDGGLEEYELVGQFLIDCEEPVELDCKTNLCDLTKICNCCSAIINTGRGGINDPRNSNFTYGGVTGFTWADFEVAMADAGYSISLSGFDQQGLPITDASLLTICGGTATQLTYDSTVFPPEVVVDMECVEHKSLSTSLDDCTIAKLAAALKTEDCDNCKPDVQTDTVCNDTDQTIDGVTIPAGQPIIRKVVTYYEANGCDCVETDVETLYFNFQDPSFQFTEDPAFIGTCNSETDTALRCDRNGNEIQVTTLTVFTDDGGLIVTTYADSNGQPIPDPLLPLSICNPDVEPIPACITTETGDTVYGTLHVQYDTAGNPGYDVSTFTANNGMSQTLGTTEFKLNCTENCVDCTVEETEYCYDTSAFTFSCDTSTITINDEVVDLCGATSGNGVFIVDGDICSTGGIRSEDDNIRHPNAVNNTGAGYDITTITSDALNVAANPASIGGLTHPSNTTVKALFGADVFGLSGTAPLITLSGTWAVGSGIGVGVYDCASNTILPMGSGETPATYDLTNFGVEIYNGGTGNWGGVSGPKTWTVDTSSVADLSTLVVYTVVINPTGDELIDLAVNGQTPMAPSCDVTDLTTLTQILEQTTGSRWTTNGDVICTKTDDVLGALTCSTTSASPTVTVEEITQKADLTRICKADLDYLINGIVTGIVGDSTECPCEDNTVQACTNFLAFDHDRGLITNGDTTAYEILLDGVSQATVVHDYTTTSDGLNVSTYYDPIIAAINAVPGWTMTLVTDVAQTDQGKPTWSVEFDGVGPSELRIEKAGTVGNLGNGDAYVFSVDANGVLTTQVSDGGSPLQPDFNTPHFSPCTTALVERVEGNDIVMNRELDLVANDQVQIAAQTKTVTAVSAQRLTLSDTVGVQVGQRVSKVAKAVKKA